MKSSMAPSWAAASVPVETTLNSLMFGLMSGCSTNVLAVLIIWIRQVLPTKPLTSAIRYGPSFFFHWKNLVCSDQGLKQLGWYPGPLTICGPAMAEPAQRPAATTAVAAKSVRRNIDQPPCYAYVPAEDGIPPRRTAVTFDCCSTGCQASPAPTDAGDGRISTVDLLGGDPLLAGVGRRVLVHLAVLHDYGDPGPIGHDGDILQQVAVDQQQVGEVALLHQPELVAHAHQLAAILGGAAQGLGRREAEQVDEVLEVAGVRALRRPGEAVVAADDDADAALLDFPVDVGGALEVAGDVHALRHLAGDAPGLGLVAGLVQEADRRTEEDPVLGLLHHVERLGVGELAVIDAVDAVADRQLDAVGRARVRGDLLAELVRDVAGHLDFFVRVRRHAARRVRVEVVARDVELDIVHALADAGPHHAPDLLRTVGDQREALAVQVELALVAQAPGRDDLGAGRAHARARELAGVDRVPDRHVEPGLGRGGAVDAGEAALEQQLGVGRGLEGVLLGRDHAELVGHRDAGERRVAVALGHAGQQRHAAPVDAARRLLAADLARAARHLLDPGALDQPLAGEAVAAGPVEHAHVREQHCAHGSLLPERPGLEIRHGSHSAPVSRPLGPAESSRGGGCQGFADAAGGHGPEDPGLRVERAQLEADGPEVAVPLEHVDEVAALLLRRGALGG